MSRHVMILVATIATTAVPPAASGHLSSDPAMSSKPPLGQMVVEAAFGTVDTMFGENAILVASAFGLSAILDNGIGASLIVAGAAFGGIRSAEILTRVLGVKRSPRAWKMVLFMLTTLTALIALSEAQVEMATDMADKLEDMEKTADALANTAIGHRTELENFKEASVKLRNDLQHLENGISENRDAWLNTIGQSIEDSGFWEKIRHAAAQADTFMENLGRNTIIASTVHEQRRVLEAELAAILSAGQQLEVD